MMGKSKITALVSVSLGLLVLINIIMIGLTIKRSRPPRKEIVAPSPYSEDSGEPQLDWLDSICPDVEMFTIGGDIVRLSSLAGNVIVLRFTRFHVQDLPYLLHLDYLKQRFAAKGIYVFFINLIGGNLNNDKMLSLSSPIIDDDGYLLSLFRARLNDTIIIGRDFRIKYMSNKGSKRTVANQVTRFLFEGALAPNLARELDPGVLLGGLSFVNIENGDIVNMGPLIKDKTALVILSISPCFTCPEKERINLVRQLASDSEIGDMPLILLFGLGNSLALIRNFKEANNLISDRIHIGVIQGPLSLSKEDYFRIFNFDIDPCIHVIKNGRACFSEDYANHEDITIEFLKRRLISCNK